MKFVFIILSVLAILTFLAIVVSSIANIYFNKHVEGEVEELFSDATNTKNIALKNQIIKKEDLKGLPLCVQKWLEQSQVVGKERIKTARLKQKALLRLEKEKPWLSTNAEQYFTVDEPGFIWKAKIKAAPFLHISGRDKYYEGKGNMLIKLLSLITVADAKDREEIDQGTLLRYLAETVWFPTAALSSYITWEEIDPNSAKATMSYGGVTAGGTFYFNDKYELTNFEAERYMEKKGEYSLEKWSVQMRDYKEFNGIKVPSKGEVIWKLKEGDFEWFQFEITDVEYNKPYVW